MTALSMESALGIARATLDEGVRRSLAPLTVAVLDPGGHLLVLLRSDGSSLLRPQIAIGKAWGALGMGFGGYELARRAAQAPAFYGALSDLSHGRMVPVPGGVLIRGTSGALLGSVGVSGDTSVQDDVCAVAAVVGAGFVADNGAAEG